MGDLVPVLAWVLLSVFVFVCVLVLASFLAFAAVLVPITEPGPDSGYEHFLSTNEHESEYEYNV